MNVIALIQAERARQLTLGYSAEFDAKYKGGELARAALARLLLAEYNGQRIGLLDVDLLIRFIAPWAAGLAPGQSRVRLLTEAAALIVAELERVLPPPEATAATDDRVHSVICEAIAVFARATGNVGRIADPALRLKVLQLLADYARHLADQIEAELRHLHPALSGDN